MAPVRVFLVTFLRSQANNSDCVGGECFELLCTYTYICSQRDRCIWATCSMYMCLVRSCAKKNSKERAKSDERCERKHKDVCTKDRHHQKPPRGQTGQTADTPYPPACVHVQEGNSGKVTAGARRIAGVKPVGVALSCNPTRWACIRPPLPRGAPWRTCLLK